MQIRKTVLVLALLLGFTSSALAQAKKEHSYWFPEENFWGVSVDITPQWGVSSLLKSIVDDDVDIEGREFRVGIVRGNPLEGDWGVSFVWSPIKDGSSIKSRSTYTYCQDANCSQVGVGHRYYFVDTSLMGLEAHKYIPLVTINNRFQFGLNVGGGALLVQGWAEKHDVKGQVTIRKDNGFDLRAINTITRVDAKEVFEDRLKTSVLPTGRLEGVFAVIVADCLKIKVASGLNFPAQHLVTVGATYFF